MEHLWIYKIITCIDIMNKKHKYIIFIYIYMYYPYSVCLYMCVCVCVTGCRLGPWIWYKFKTDVIGADTPWTAGIFKLFLSSSITLLLFLLSGFHLHVDHYSIQLWKFYHTFLYNFSSKLIVDFFLLICKDLIISLCKTDTRLH